MYSQPIFIIVITFILGIFFQEFIGVNYWLSVIIVVVMFLLSIISFYFFRWRIKMLILGFLFLSLGSLCHFINKNQHPAEVRQSSGNIAFKLEEKLKSNTKNKRYKVEVFFDNKRFNAVLSIPKTEQDLDFRHYYSGFGFIHRIEKPSHDFLFDYQKYMMIQRVFHQIYIPEIESVSEIEKTSFRDRVRQFRQNILLNINKSRYISQKNKELLKGIILADRTEMDTETTEDFAKAGVVHILAISGTHFGIIFGVILWGLSKLIDRRKSIVIALIFIWLFALLIDFGNSVTRSCLMISIYFISVLLQRKSDLLHSLSLSAMVILMIDTQQIFDVGFQLSYSAVLGIYWFNKVISNRILMFNPRIMEKIQKNRLGQYFLSLLSMTIAAQLGTLPLIIFYFHQVPLISILVNFLVIPLSECLIIVSLFITILFGFGVNAQYINIVYDGFASIFLKLVKVFASIDGFLLENIYLNSIEFIFLLVIVYLLRDFIEKFSMKINLRLLLVLFVFIGVRWGSNQWQLQKNEKLMIDYFDTNIMIIKNKGVATIIIPPKLDIKQIRKNIIFPYMNSRRIGDIKIVIENIEDYELKTITK